MRNDRQHDRTVTEALVNVVEAGHRLVSDRVDLAIVEARGMIAVSVTSAAFILIGSLVIAGALIAVDFALVEIVSQVAPRSVAYAACAIADGVVGGIFVSIGLRKREDT